MQRVIMRAVLGMILLTGLAIAPVWGADLKVIQTQKAKDMTITLLSESGQWDTAGHRGLGWAGGQGLDPVLGPCPLRTQWLVVSGQWLVKIWFVLTTHH